jgi:hypothetical protein
MPKLTKQKKHHHNQSIATCNPVTIDWSWCLLQQKPVIQTQPQIPTLQLVLWTAMLLLGFGP